MPSPPALMTVKNSFTFLTIVQFLPSISGLWLSSHICHEFIPKFHEGRDSLMQELCNSSKMRVSPWYSIRDSLNVLLLGAAKCLQWNRTISHDPHVYAFCPLFVPCSSAKCKMSLKTGMHTLQSWTFSGDKPALGVLICDTPTDLLCSEGVSSSWTPRQVPENKEVTVKCTLTLLEERTSHHNSISDTCKKHSTDCVQEMELG